MPDRREDRNVEDVLSSVRRLVSGELSHRVRRTSPPQALVLTPTQRVSQARERAGTQSLEDRIAELEAQLAGRQDEWEPDGSEDQSAHRPTQTFARALRFDDDMPEAPTPPEPPRSTRDDIFVPDAALEDEPTPPLPPRVRRLSRIELIETSPAEDDDAQAKPQPDAPQTEPDFDRDLARAVARSVNSVISEITAEDGPLRATEADETADAQPDAIEEHPDLAPSLEDDAESAVREALLAASRLHADLDNVMAEEPAVTPAPDTSAPEDVAEPVAPAAIADDDLRALVSQLIREELQGELGARITRNLRKLVRREIQRALATRDLS